MAPRARQATTASKKQQHSIDAYAMLRKPAATQALKTGLDVKRDILGLRSSGLKRKAVSDEEDSQSSDETTSKRQRRSSTETQQRPSAVPSKRSVASHPECTRTPATKALPSARAPTTTQPTIDPTAATSRREDLPSPLASLLHLHKSLLRALTLHIAHNGTAAPIPLHYLTTSASKIDKKRAITNTDILRCYALYGTDLSSTTKLSLHDFGAPLGLCLELTVTSTSTRIGNTSSPARLIDEETLHDLFSHNLLTQWHAWNGLRSPKPASVDLSDDAETFIAGLPLANIAPHPSAILSRTVSSTILGRSRLESLTPRNRGEKHGGGRAATGLGGLLTPGGTPSSTTDTDTSTPNTVSTGRTTPKDRKSGLYARLAVKAATAGPKKPSPADVSKEADRRAAICFLPELVKILAGLARGKRRSFGLGEVVRVVRESSRSVVEEGVVRRALGMLGGEHDDHRVLDGLGNGDREGKEEALAPEYVKIVRIGEKALGVVVDGRARPDDLDERIRGAIAMTR